MLSRDQVLGWNPPPQITFSGGNQFSGEGGSHYTRHCRTSQRVGERCFWEGGLKGLVQLEPRGAATFEPLSKAGKESTTNF